MNSLYRIFDTREKSYFTETFKSKFKAECYKFHYLDMGNYPDRPHTVLQIHKFRQEKFIKDVTY